MLFHPRTGAAFPSPVKPGTGWPGDPATLRTPVANSGAEVAEQAQSARRLRQLDAQISVCRACPRLVQWREEVAVVKRRSFADEPYWGRPIPGWGADRPRIFVLGLAPAANGANRTGRVFTGDRSGDQLFASLFRCGLVNRETSVDAADGLQSTMIRISAAVRCAPPGNAPTPQERVTCSPWLGAEWAMIARSVQVVVTLGGFAWQAALELLADELPPGRKPKFGHGATVELTSGRLLLGCFHPSQQNMFTGRLTPQMLDQVFAEARARAGLGMPGSDAGVD